MAVVWRGDTVAEPVPSALGDVVILPMQRSQIIDETTGRSVSVAS